MTNIEPSTMTQPARTHAEAAALFRRPLAPAAIGFRAKTKVPYNGQPYAGGQVAAYIGAQSVIQRLNAVFRAAGASSSSRSLPSSSPPARGASISPAG